MISFGSTLQTTYPPQKKNDITDITILTAAAKRKSLWLGCFGSTVISAQAAKAHHAWEWLALQVLPQEIAWVASDSQAGQIDKPSS